MYTHTRNPHPIPDITTEGYWNSDGPALGKNVSPNDRHWKTKANVSERLFSHHTLSSIRKDSRLVRNKEPQDALDYSLSSIYLHGADFMVPKMYVFMQPETLNLETWRQLRNELKPASGSMTETERSKQRVHTDRLFISGKYHSALPSKTQYMSNELSKSYSHQPDDDIILDKNQRRVTYASQMRAIERIHPSSLKLAIEGPHADQTNPGYSRKTDGTFYSI